MSKDEASEVIHEAVEKQPNGTKKKSRLRRIGRIFGVLFLLFVIWYVFVGRSVPPRISKETTWVTEPRTPDGKMVDYIAAIELKLYPPEMRTDDNGYRILVRKIGLIETSADIDHTQQRYEKLGLDMVNDPPTLTFTDPHTHFFNIHKNTPEEFDEILSQDTEVLDSLMIWEEIAKLPEMHELPIVQQWLEENNAALDLVVETTKKNVFVPPIVVPKQSNCALLILLPDIQGIRGFARGLDYRAIIRISQGDIDGAIEDILACYRLGRHLSKHAFLVSQLVGLSCEGIAHDIAFNGNLMTQANTEQLKRLRDGLDALPPRATCEDAMEYERISTLDLVRAMMQDPGGTQKMLNSSEYWGAGMPPAVKVIARMGMDWNVVFRRINEAYDADMAGTFDYRAAYPSFNPLRYLTLRSRSKEFGSIIIAMFMPSTEAAKEAQRRLECIDNLKRITLAMLLYNAENGTLPPTFTVDDKGKPLHSWRVLLLPYLGDKELVAMYEQIRLDEPWDSEHNRQFHEKSLSVYRCPTAGLEPGKTSYCVILGNETPFGNDGIGKSLDGFGSNSGGMPLVAERRVSANWMDPAFDVTFEQAKTGISGKPDSGNVIGSYHTGGANFGLRGGGVSFFSETIEPELWQNVLTGKERVW